MHTLHCLSLTHPNTVGSVIASSGRHESRQCLCCAWARTSALHATTARSDACMSCTTCPKNPRWASSTTRCAAITLGLLRLCVALAGRGSRDDSVSACGHKGRNEAHALSGSLFSFGQAILHAWVVITKEDTTVYYRIHAWPHLVRRVRNDMHGEPVRCREPVYLTTTPAIPR